MQPQGTSPGIPLAVEKLSDLSWPWDQGSHQQQQDRLTSCTPGTALGGHTPPPWFQPKMQNLTPIPRKHHRLYKMTTSANMSRPQKTTKGWGIADSQTKNHICKNVELGDS